MRGRVEVSRQGVEELLVLRRNRRGPEAGDNAEVGGVLQRAQGMDQRPGGGGDHHPLARVERPPYRAAPLATPTTQDEGHDPLASEVDLRDAPPVGGQV